MFVLYVDYINVLLWILLNWKDLLWSEGELKYMFIAFIMFKNNVLYFL